MVMFLVQVLLVVLEFLQVGGALVGTYLGVENSFALSLLHLGDCEFVNSATVIVFGEKTLV